MARYRVTFKIIDVVECYIEAESLEKATIEFESGDIDAVWETVDFGNLPTDVKVVKVEKVNKEGETKSE